MRQILIAILISAFCFACSKQENKETVDSAMPNSAEIISGASGAKETLYAMAIQVGHSGSGCSGCVTSGGSHIHVDCQGAGSACRIRATMNVSNTGEKNIYHYGTVADPDELTDGDSFLMPARSLYIIGSNGEFLNIPEQVAYRDEETGAFIFYDIFYSDYQAFENE
ncbi:MAG: hypothetical protein FWC34_03750 [Bacteroidetes bacterium]|nr:hypothetical protein [Bacteroidota bacterium]MCL2303446.1 hypothetical protein [Lentimicrobiaceae bacterium]